MVRRRINTGPKGTTGTPLSRRTLQGGSAYHRRLREMQEGDRIFPLTAPDLPPLPPNSAFLSHVQALGCEQSQLIEETYTDQDGKKKKRQRLAYSDELYKLIQSALREPGFSLPVEIGAHREKEATFVPGHYWEQTQARGPRKADVMIINKLPWVDDVHAKQCLIGEEGRVLLGMFQRAKAKRLGRYYLTNLVKFMPPNWKTTLKAAWIKDCLHLLYQELKIVQPKYILCLGADASKALLGQHASVSAMEGRVETITYSSAFTLETREDHLHEAKVMTVTHPKQVLRDQAAARQLEDGIGRFVALTNGVEVGATEQVDHRSIDNLMDLIDCLRDAETDETKVDDVVSVDAEWEGEHPCNKGSYVRTVQFAWQPKKAAAVKLYEAGGQINPNFLHTGKDGKETINPLVLELLRKYFNGGTVQLDKTKTLKCKPKRIVGHFFNSDLEWLVDLDIDLRKGFESPIQDLEIVPYKQARSKRHRRLLKLYREEGFQQGDIVPAWFRTKYEGGADTGLMAHAIEETATYKLETLAMRHTTAPRYDEQLVKWRTDFCKERGISSAHLEGYGECPDEILIPYGIYDADVTLRLFYKFDVLLEEDYEGNNCRESFWESQIAASAVLEIHRTGILADRNRADFLTERFVEARASLEEQIRSEIFWPEFNIRSLQQVKEFLFGHHLNGRLDTETGKPVRIRPPGAMSLQLTPIFDTSKPPKPWREIQKLHKEGEHSPSTNKQVLSLLAQAAPTEEKSRLVNMIRDYRFLDQVLKTVLRPPLQDDDSQEFMRNDEGNFEYADGLVSSVCDDGRIRTHIYQTKETGRWASARPNLQNISKQRDPDYKRLLGTSYKYSLRSILKASPGHVLIEADYVGAELFGMAVMSGDPTMIEHAMRNQLPEEDPNFYDIHSNVACFAFRLNCPPTKSGLDSIGKKHIRIVAKSVIFGIAYGRGAKAIAVAAKEQGIDITVDEAQAVIDAIFEMYPGLEPFFEECRLRALGQYVDPRTNQPVENNWLCNCYGRFRRFPDSSWDQGIASEFERQAMNFPIQSMIASAMSRAIAYLHAYKRRQARKGWNLFNIVLQVHDAVLLEVPFRYVRHVCEYVLPTYMREAVPIWPSRLDGIPTGDGPYFLGIEADVMNHWGEVLTYQEAHKARTPTGTTSVNGCVTNYSKARPPRKRRSVVQASKVRPPRVLDKE